MNKIYKILLSIIAILSSAFLCAMEHTTKTARIPETNLLDLPNEMLMQIAHELGNRDLAHFNQAAWRTQEITQATLQQRHEQWLSRNIITVDCYQLRNSHPDVDGFINAVLKKLTSAHKDNPDRWFKLDLSSKNLGYLSQNDLKKLFDNICQRVESLKIHLVRLDLSHNQLQTLPNNIFDRLVNLQSLSLYSNQLNTLPNNIFDNLGNLQSLSLFNNQLQTLPNNIFDNLGNLQWLYLSNNQLQTLPNNIFDNLGNLQVLYLHHNHLQELPNNIFDRLGKLQNLSLSNNQLQTLPNNIFDNLGNLKELWLGGNQFDHATLNALQALKTARPGIDIRI